MVVRMCSRPSLHSSCRMGWKAGTNLGRTGGGRAEISVNKPLEGGELKSVCTNHWRGES